MWEWWIDGAIALVVASLFTQWRSRRVRKEARELHDSALDASKELYQREAQRLSHHIQGKRHVG